jgi:hypothetical protein
MIIEFFDRVGGRSFRIPVAQVVVRTDDNTPLAVAAEYGPRGGYLAACASDDPKAHRKFEQALQRLRINDHVFVDSYLDKPLPDGTKVWTPHE